MRHIGFFGNACGIGHWQLKTGEYDGGFSRR